MEMSDSRLIDAPPATVWAAILDPMVLKACVPGCEEMTGSAEDGFEAVVTQKVGPVKARFTGAVGVSERVEGQSLVLTGEGKGGAAGFAKGIARVALAAEGDGTRLTYEVEAKVGGKLAQLGSRLIDGFARKMADDFFERFQSAVEGPEDEGDAEAPEADTDTDAPKKGWFKRLISD